MTYKYDPIGIGATDELSLRVSVATLVRVLFERPSDGEVMLALERKATLLFAPGGTPGQHFADVKSQPFGGALQIRDLRTLRDHIGDFHFDSEQSHSELDFRIFIHPSAWEMVREFCLGHLRQADDPVLEGDPVRELTEEFVDTLKISLKPDQYMYKLVGTIVEDNPLPTESIHARGYRTSRIYRIFEARILDPSLVNALMINSESYSDQNLQELAFQNSQGGGRGWANTILTLPLKRLSAFYLAMPPEARNAPASFQNHQLDETVAAVLEGITVPKYRRL